MKVLDFGLAKAMDPSARSSDPAYVHSQAPTITSPAHLRDGYGEAGLTGVGMVLGTAAYMSPEQARGRAVDTRTDIWAFGCVLYEMLTGKRAFSGEDVGDVLGAVMHKEPDWSACPPQTPPRLKRLIVRCLEKDQRRRQRDIADARFELEDLPLSDAASPAEISRGSSRSWRVLPVVLALAGVVAGWLLRSTVDDGSTTSASAAELRFQIVTPTTTDPASIAMSPDGLRVAFVASVQGRPTVWVQELDSAEARPLAGTEDGEFPFWSPDSQSLGFFSNGLLKRVDIDIGTVQTLAPGSRGGTWNRDGIIVFSPGPGPVSLSRVAASGGTVSEATERRSGQGSHRFPQFLPDGHHFIFFVASAVPAARGVYVGELDSTATTRLIEADSAAVYATSGHLLFTRQGALVAQPFDAARLALTGEPIAIAKDVPTSGPLSLAPVSASATGGFIYRTGTSVGDRQFVWFDRSGREVERIGEPVANLLSPALSPDRRRVAVHRNFNSAQNVWILDLRGGILSRFTSTRGEYHPVWSPDGRRIALNADGNLYVRAESGTGSEELLFDSREATNPTDWSRDGRYLLYFTSEPRPDTDIWALPLDGTRMPIPVVRTSFNERDGEFSPDGKWIAYTSDESGRSEIYVQTFPDGARRRQVSRDGGAMARWRADGRELFYVALDGRLMAVPMDLGRGEAAAQGPVALFATRIGGAFQANSRQQYMVSLDGERFLMNTLAEETPAPITVVLNWKGGARPRLEAVR